MQSGASYTYIFLHPIFYQLLPTMKLKANDFNRISTNSWRYKSNFEIIVYIKQFSLPFLSPTHCETMQIKSAYACASEFFTPALSPRYSPYFNKLQNDGRQRNT